MKNEKIDEREISLREFIDTAKVNFHLNQDSRHEGRESFYKCSFDQAVEYFEKGYKLDTDEFLVDVDELSAKLKEEFSRDYIPDVTGEFFDIGKVLTGEPECWFEKPMDSKKGINLIVSMDFP